MPLRARARGRVVLGTWDRTVVPLPGGVVAVQEGEPLRVAREADADAVAAARARLEGWFGGGEDTP